MAEVVPVVLLPHPSRTGRDERSDSLADEPLPGVDDIVAAVTALERVGG